MDAPCSKLSAEVHVRSAPDAVSFLHTRWRFSTFRLPEFSGWICDHHDSPFSTWVLLATAMSGERHHCT